MRRAVEGDKGDPVLDISDERVENGIQFSIVVEMTGARAAGLDHDHQS